MLSFHDFHVTHTTLHYNSDLENMEITIKVAIEDLELSLENKELRIGTLNEIFFSEEIIKSYFKNHLKIYGNNKIIDYKWVGKEISDNLHDIYIYFEISNFNQIAKIKSLILACREKGRFLLAIKLKNKLKLKCLLNPIQKPKFNLKKLPN